MAKGTEQQAASVYPQGTLFHQDFSGVPVKMTSTSRIPRQEAGINTIWLSRVTPTAGAAPPSNKEVQITTLFQ